MLASPDSGAQQLGPGRCPSAPLAQFLRGTTIRKGLTKLQVASVLKFHGADVHAKAYTGVVSGRLRGRAGCRFCRRGDTAVHLAAKSWGARSVSEVPKSELSTLTLFLWPLRSFPLTLFPGPSKGKWRGRRSNRLNHSPTVPCAWRAPHRSSVWAKMWTWTWNSISLLQTAEPSVATGPRAWAHCAEIQRQRLFTVPRDHTTPGWKGGNGKCDSNGRFVKTAP